MTGRPGTDLLVTGTRQTAGDRRGRGAVGADSKVGGSGTDGPPTGMPEFVGLVPNRAGPTGVSGVSD